MASGFIYILKQKNGEGEKYVGSTCQSLQARFNHHKKCCNTEKYRQYNCPTYQHIRANGGIENWMIESVETITSHDKPSLRKLLVLAERKHYDEIKPVLNTLRPVQTDDERKGRFRIHKIKSQFMETAEEREIRLAKKRAWKPNPEARKRKYELEKQRMAAMTDEQRKIYNAKKLAQQKARAAKDPEADRIRRDKANARAKEKYYDRM